MIADDFHRRLASARAAAGTQDEMAARIGVGVRLLQRWEAGEVRPRLDKFVDFCEAVDASADYLLGFKESPAAQSDVLDAGRAPKVSTPPRPRAARRAAR